MKFYVTVEPVRRLKRVISNLCSYYIINVDEILEQSGLDADRPSHRYLINTEIERLITSGARSKRYLGVMYINKNLDCDTVVAIREMLSKLTSSSIDGIAVVDDYDAPKLRDYYKLVDEVVFFHPLKRGKIIECVSKTSRRRRNVFDKDI